MQLMQVPLCQKIWRSREITGMKQYNKHCRWKTSASLKRPVQRISFNKLTCQRNIAHKNSIIWFEVLLLTKKILPPKWASTWPCLKNICSWRTITFSVPRSLPIKVGIMAPKFSTLCRKYLATQLFFDRYYLFQQTATRFAYNIYQWHYI
jgi:hypothetical protein